MTSKLDRQHTSLLLINTLSLIVSANVELFAVDTVTFLRQVLDVTIQHISIKHNYENSSRVNANLLYLK